MRIFMFIFAALIAAGGTGYYLFLALNQAPVEAPVIVEAPKSKEVFVPAATLAAGTIVTPERLGRMRIEVGAVTAEMIVADDAGRDFLMGSVARQDLPKGVPIARSIMVQPGERGFLAAVLPKGKRAISIPITEVAGMSGLVMPGDRVDIILTYSVDGDVIDAGRNIRASETLLTNLRVLALDQRMQTGQVKDKDGNLVPPPIPRTAALEVTPEQAEMITLATRLGDLSMVLNSVRDGGDPDPDEMEVADADAADMLEPLRLGATRPRARTDEGGPRELTIDSEVTSLLLRPSADSEEALADPALGNPVPPADRTSRVQVVRGSATRALRLSPAVGGEGGEAGGEPAATAATTAAPAAEHN